MLNILIGDRIKPVCYFTSSWRGGDGWYSHALAEAIANAGQPLIFIASQLTPIERDAQHKLITRRLVHSSSARSVGFVGKCIRSGRRVVEFLFQMARARKETNIYLITFPHWLIFTYVSFIMLKLTGGKIVYIVHDPLPHAWSFPSALRGIERGLLAQTYAMADRLVTLTGAGKDTMVSEFHLDPNKIAIIPHGAFPVAGAKPPKTTRRLLLFGMLRRNKNILPTIEAIDLVSREFPDLEFYIAGAPHNDDLIYWAECEKRIRSSSATIHVEAGFVTDQRMEELFTICDAVLLPYEEFNSQSGVAVLAGFAKRPVLTTGVGGIRELIDLGLVSFPIACPVSVDAIAGSVRKFCRTDPCDLEKAIESGYDRLAEALSWQEVGKSFAELLSKT